MNAKPYAPRQTLARVRETLSRFAMIRRNDRVIVAVSGGADSVCLLHLLHSLEYFFSLHLVVAHFSHGLRPEEDSAETDFVRQVAASLRLPFEWEKGSPTIGAGPSIEERARNARYDFLERTREKHGAQKIALGHTLNDQAETLLMRLLRGSGPAGLASIPPVRNGTIVRPLIETERREIEAYLNSRGLAWKTDSSNLRPVYLRNRVRLELIPVLEKYQPRLIKRLGQTAAILRDEDDCLEKLAQTWLTTKVDVKPGGSVRISIPSLRELPVALRRRVTRQLIVKVKKDLRQISSEHIEATEKLMRSDVPQGTLTLPNRVRINRAYDHLVFSTDPTKRPESFLYSLAGPGEHPIEEIGRRISILELPYSTGFPLEGSPWTAFLDAEKVHYPLTLRSFRAGDRFVPLGMTGHKKIKKLFVDLKIPTSERLSTPILCCDDSPVWVCGFRIDDRFKVGPETKRVMKVVIELSSEI